MADIQTYLDAIENAVYGEDVRGSIHDAIEIINDVGEKVITAGTAVTSASSSTEGFFKNSLYFNTNTNDLWQCNGTGWTLLGNLKGDQGDQGNPGQAATIAVGTVTKGDNASVVNSGTSSAAVFDFVLPKGDPGPAGVNTWGSLTGDIDDQTDLVNALEDTYKDAENLVENTVGWSGANIFDIDAVEMGVDIYGEASTNAACFTFDCEGSTDYYLTVNGVNNLSIAYTTSSLGAMQIIISSFPFKLTTRAEDTWVKIEFTKANIAESDISALNFMISRIEGASYAAHHKPVSEWGYTREEANVLGAKNLFDYKGDYILYYDSIEYVTNGVHVQGTQSATYGNVRFPVLNKYKNKRVRLSCDVDYVSGTVAVYAKSSPDRTSSGDVITNSQSITSDTHVELEFNTGSTEYLVFQFLTSLGTSQQGEATFTNIMLRLASDPDDTYRPYAMTNRELTDKLVKKDTFSGTTTANGNIKIYAGTDRWILGAMLDYTANQGIVGVYRGTANEIWGNVRIPDSSGGIRANTDVSGEYYYIQL